MTAGPVRQLFGISLTQVEDNGVTSTIEDQQRSFVPATPQSAPVDMDEVMLLNERKDEEDEISARDRSDQARRLWDFPTQR